MLATRFATRLAARPERAWALAAFIAGFLVYAPSIGNGFAFDDHPVIEKNRFLRSVEALPQLVSNIEWAGAGYRSPCSWRPLMAVTLALNHAAGGLSPWSYHATNALLHGVASMLLVLLGVRLGLAAAAAGAGALLFAVHPIHVEAVANVVGRKDVLATVFLLLMLLSHGWAARRGGLRLVAPLAAYAAAMLSKEVGAVGLGLAVLRDLLAEDGCLRSEGAGTRRRAIVLHLSYAAALVGYLVTFNAVTGGATLRGLPAFADNPAAYAPLGVRLMSAVAVLGKGLALLALPVGQSADWSYDAIPLVTSAVDLRFLVSASLLVAWLALGLRLRATRPLVLLALGWHLASLSPVANVLVFSTGTIFGERLLYLPSAALALLAGDAFVALLSRTAGRLRPALAAGCAALLVLLAAGAVRYAAAWGNELRLFEWARESAPRSTKVHHKLAELLLADGRGEEALAEIRLALEILPANALAEVTHAAILRNLGRTGEQEQSARRALALMPANPNAAYEVACVERDAGRLEAAAALLTQAIGWNPGHAPALSDLSAWHLLRGEDELALGLAERAVEANPDLASAWYNLGLARRRRGDAARARQAFTRFVETAGKEYAAEAAAVRREMEGASL